MKTLKYNDTYIAIVSCAPMIKLPDARTTFKCEFLHSNYLFDEYSKSFYRMMNYNKNTKLEPIQLEHIKQQMTYSGAKKYLVSHQLCKFSHLKR